VSPAADPIEGVELARRGAALRLRLAGGRSRLVRRIDLAPLLGRPAPDAPRFHAVRRVPAGVEVDLADGDHETIEECWLLPARSAELVITGARLLTCDGERDDPLGRIDGGALIAGGGKILWVGRAAALGEAGVDLAGAERVDAGGRLLSPGLVDCHAHPVWAGSRVDEFERRAAGATYLEIAAAGGGIRATLEPTRAAGFDALVALTCARMGRALAAGTTTCEAKSGYDLTAPGELRLLEAALVADALQPVDLSPTLLAAHALPPERAGDRDGFVREVAEVIVPEAAARRLATAVDVYCDQGAFTRDETRRMLSAGRAAGLGVRAHAGQFADLGGAELVAELGGSSADHLEQVSPAGIAALAAAGVVAVMLPAACVQLGLAPPPVAALRAAGVPLAVATDMNPGSTCGETLPLAMWLACTHYQMTVTEAWLGVTRQAARALGRHDVGVLAAGATADLVLWNTDHPADLPYRFSENLVAQVIKAGRVVVPA
jgi:imidazolonepropionase